jgi:hypothetical protein
MDGSSGADTLLAAAAPVRSDPTGLPEPVEPLEFVDRFAMKLHRSL